MTSPKPMRIEELLELAALDAYGLLDEYEAELYTRSFHHAPVAVQDEILRIQAEIASDQSTLPADLPNTELRRRVLDAVARAIEEDARELAPLASIGQRFAINSAPLPAIRTRLTLTGQFWRTAALVMVGVSIVLAWFGAEARQRADEISRLALRNNTDGRLEYLIGPTLKSYLGKPNVTQRFLTVRASNTDLFAWLYVDPADRSAFLVVTGSATGAGYSVRAVFEDGSTSDPAPFEMTTTIASLRLENLPSTAAAVHWEILDSDQRVVLRTA